MTVSIAEVGDSPNIQRWHRLGQVLLGIVLILVYLPSLGGGFLNWDDPWLVENNPVLRMPWSTALHTIFFDFSFASRYSLGAEYLPLRDLSYWVDAALYGESALGYRVTNLLLYAVALMGVWRIGRELTRHVGSALLIVACFALHPVHVESVAWISGRKDLLSLAFGCWVFALYLGRTSRRLPWLFLLTLGAMLSKTTSVAILPMLFAFDVLKRQKPDFCAVLSVGAATVAVLPVAFWVGTMVGISEPQPGGSVLTNIATMGPVWTRYALGTFFPSSLSLVQEVGVQRHWGAASSLGYLLVFGPLLVGVRLAFKRRQPQLLGLLLLFWLPLLPVSQLLVPLQNRMADRYLYFSVLAPAVGIALLVGQSKKVGGAVAFVLLLLWTHGTFERASLFGDSELAFRDATEKTQHNAVAPFQLAMALEAQGKFEEAIHYYSVVWLRSGGQGEPARRATNNWARLLAKRGDLREAERVLVRGLASFPSDTKMRENLDKVLDAQRRFRP